MDIQERTYSQLRDHMDEVVLEAARGDVFALTNHNRRTGAALVPQSLLEDEDRLVALLREIAPARLATDQELAGR